MPVRSLAVWSRSLVLACAWSSIIGAASGQEKAPAAPQEVEVLAAGARELGAFAAQATKSGFPGRAKVAWLEVIGEYDPDDADARKALGFYRHGAVWQRDAAFVYPERDQPDAAAARLLEQRWQALATKLGGLHRAAAAALAAAGDQPRADHHARRALRFTPNDPKAVAQASLRQLEGITGDDVDLTLLQRSRTLDRALTRIVAQSFAAELAPDRLPLLDEFGLVHQCVASEHFRVFGDHDPAVLKEAAVWAERALAFCKEAFAGFQGFPPRGKPEATLVFLRKRSDWQGIVRKKALPREADFLADYALCTTLGDVHAAGTDVTDVVFDLAVRWVAQDFSGLTADALEEGIGHAIVGMFFGRNLVFTIGIDDPSGTVAGPRDRAKSTLPDLDTWKELAIELAWRESGTSAARLPLLQAAELQVDARIKAWSFCDYLLRRDPALLTALQRTAAKATNENDVLAAFEQFAGHPLQLVEQRWRRFWTEDSPLRRAIVTKVTPLEAASKEAPAWLALFNQLRTAHGHAPVGWSAQLSTACREHVDYLRNNKDQRGPDKEHLQLPGRPGYSNSARAFAADALVWCKDAKKAAETWSVLPGFRDALVNANIDLVGIYAEGGVVVVDGLRGRLPGERVATQVWPAGGDDGRAPRPVPAAVDVEPFGAELQRLLAANQRAKQKQIGYPLTLHTYHATNIPEASCTVTCDGAPVAGFFVRATGDNPRTSARGLWVFYPAEPWRRGVDHVATWRWTGGEHKVTFVAD